MSTITEQKFAVGDKVRVADIPGMTGGSEDILSKYSEQIVTITSANQYFHSPTGWEYRAQFTTTRDDGTTFPTPYYFYDAERVTDDTPPVDVMQEKIDSLTRSLEDARKDRDNLLSFLDMVNDVGNEMADDFSMCDNYEGQLDTWNTWLADRGLSFRFVGRKREVEVRVERTMTEMCYITITVDHGSDNSDIYSTAIEQADEYGSWETTDIDNYEVDTV